MKKDLHNFVHTVWKGRLYNEQKIITIKFVSVLEKTGSLVGLGVPFHFTSVCTEKKCAALQICGCEEHKAFPGALEV